MSSLQQRLVTYLEGISEDRPDLVPEPASVLPLFLRGRYTVFSTRLFGRKMLLALQAEDWEPSSPGEYAKHEEGLRAKHHEPVVLVLPGLPSYARNRMVKMGIPFIVPGSQTFIPNTLMDLRERFPKPGSKRRGTLSPAAQATVLFHLLRGPIANESLKDIAQKVHYSAMMMTKVKNELESARICKTVRSGRSMVLSFNANGQSLWEQVKTQLASPVKKARWVRSAQPAPSALLAGMSALSVRTMISADRLPTYAVLLAEFQESLERGVWTGCHDAENATAKIEVWSYDPRLLSDERTVDPLSLYLSLRNSADERVEQQLEQLVKDVKW